MCYVALCIYLYCYEVTLLMILINGMYAITYFIDHNILNNFIVSVLTKSVRCNVVY